MTISGLTIPDAIMTQGDVQTAKKPSAVTYEDIFTDAGKYCPQCVFTGGQWTAASKKDIVPIVKAKCQYKPGFAKTGLEKIDFIEPSKGRNPISYKDLFDGLALCRAASAESTTLGQHDAKEEDYWKHSNMVPNCLNSFSSDKFSSGIPTGKTSSGNTFSFTWSEHGPGDWCYLNQALPSGFSGGLLMTHIASDDTEFALRVTSGSSSTYFNCKSIITNQVNKTLDDGDSEKDIPFTNVDTIEIYYR